ncbi:MAG: segregation/condensation protein A [Candidatus Edwardsbacteria bacterium]
MSYQIRLDLFEGPLDLLLYLIKKEELDIYDIPIARVTQQYLEYLELMKILDLEIAGEFLVMAATLLRIKAQMLLPRPQAEEIEIEDPRQDLVLQLLEYQKFKEIATKLGRKEIFQRQLFARPRLTFEEEPEIPETSDVAIIDLLTAFKAIVDRIDRVTLYEIAGEDITIEERIIYILQILSEKERITFFELFSPITRRLIIVVTFFALLELMRLKKIKAKQEKLFGEIWIEKN